MHNYKNRLKPLFIAVALLFFNLAYTQIERAIDNKGTMKKVRNTRVYIGETNKPADANAGAVIGDVYFDKYDMSTNPKKYPTVMQVWSGTEWIRFSSGRIIAAGEVSANGSCTCSGADARYTSNGEYYWINNFKAPGKGRYIIQLTLKALPTGEWDRQIYYYDKDDSYNANKNNFKVKITDSLGAAGGLGNKRKKGDFSFVIISLP